MHWKHLLMSSCINANCLYEFYIFLTYYIHIHSCSITSGSWTVSNSHRCVVCTFYPFLSCYIYMLVLPPIIGAFHFRASNVGATWAVVTMILGIWIAVISFAGYFGTATEHLGFSRAYIALLSMVLILETGEGAQLRSEKKKTAK